MPVKGPPKRTKRSDDGKKVTFCGRSTTLAESASGDPQPTNDWVRCRFQAVDRIAVAREWNRCERPKYNNTLRFDTRLVGGSDCAGRERHHTITQQHVLTTSGVGPRTARGQKSLGCGRLWHSSSSSSSGSSSSSSSGGGSFWSWRCCWSGNAAPSPPTPLFYPHFRIAAHFSAPLLITITRFQSFPSRFLFLSNHHNWATSVDPPVVMPFVSVFSE